MKSLKLITTTVVLAFAVNANAQELDSNANLKNVLDWFYAPLDTSSYITSGLFMDKVGMDYFLLKKLVLSDFTLSLSYIKHRLQ
ncbi:MAG: hypothetical protein M0R38_06670 [Bacteroidia bacterium]|nr:hypothetical protein [Bacteroidia bacterium]MCK9481425.1 hypothetical protein [Bacteroidia bacterium]MCO5253658.1 hypothetical protein [Bacteroidota bacterium]